MRSMLLLFVLLCAVLMHAQVPDGGTGIALNFSRSMSIPLNAVHLFDEAQEAWIWTFGKEPGAKLLRADREDGVLEGSARINFRSTMLTGREETTGTISYHVQFQIRAGECRAVVTGLTHSGNRNTGRGGIHVGQLMRNDLDAPRTSGLGRANVVRLHAELREVATARVNSLLQAMEARIRASVEP